MKRAILVVLVLVAVAGCASTSRTVSKTQAVIPTFDWTPPTVATPASAGVTFAVVGGDYAKQEPWVKSYPFNKFAGNMKNDFQELLNARGFTTTGPFESVDEMTYPDKKACELILEPKIDLDVDLSGAQWQQHTQLLGNDYYTVNGTAVVSGRVNLSSVESLSGTRMWTKSIAIDQMTVPWQGTKQFAVPGGALDATGLQMMREEGLGNALAPVMEAAYKRILDKAWAYLNPDEMKVVKTQAMDVKEKTTFSGNK